METQVQVLDEADLISHSANTPAKVMKLTVLRSTINSRIVWAV